MYDHLRGTLEAKTPARAVVDVNGIGFGVDIPLSTFERLPAPGDKVRLFTVLVVREDAHRLFGFGTRNERTFFQALTSVSGVGPAVGLGIVSSMPFATFQSAVLSGDAAGLQRVKGVGKRLSERLVVELRDVMKRMTPPGEHADPADAGVRDALMALEHKCMISCMLRNQTSIRSLYVRQTFALV